jgi:hypothetical protein
MAPDRRGVAGCDVWVRWIIRGVGDGAGGPSRNKYGHAERRPPRTTRAGHLHVATRQPGLPVRPEVPHANESPVGAGPLTGLTRPGPAGVAPVMTQRRLDRGRLYIPALIAAAGWPTAVHLGAEVPRPGLVRLRPAGGLDGSVAGSSRPHTDAAGRIVLTQGIRVHLGVEATGEVLAVLRDGGVIDIVAPARIITALEALDTIETTVRTA